jgi:hypothetical protein
VPAKAEPKADPVTTPLQQYVDVFKEDWAALPLAQKLAKIVGTLENIPKKDYNQAQKYRFARETDLVASIRPYLAAAGIVLTFSVIEHEVIPRQNPDAKGLLTRVRVHWAVTDGHETLEGNMDGYGMDAGDKGVYKAITGAKKYILMTLFLIDTGDDPEADVKTDRMATDEYNSYGQDEVPPRPAPVVTKTARTDIVRGGHTAGATDTQRERVIEAVRMRGWSARQFLEFIRETLAATLVDAPEDDATRLRGYLTHLLEGLTPEDMGKLLLELDRADA